MHTESRQSGQRQDAVILLAAILLAYANAFSGVFQFDDYHVIVQNAGVHDWSAWRQDVLHGIRPLLKLTYTLDWTAGGIALFHLTNLLVHCANTLLVWRLSRHFVEAHPVLSEYRPVPLIAALLFALHPAQTEAVTYICGRSVSLMALFYLAGLLLYIHGRARHSKFLLHILVPGCMVLALLSKETAVTFPAALLLWEVFTGGTLRSAMRWQWSSWLLLMLSIIFFWLHQGYWQEMHNSLQLNSLGGNVATQMLAVVYLLRQWFAPLWLNIDPDLPVLQGFAGLWPHLLILVFLLAVMVVTWKRRPWLGFAISWALLHLAPLYLVLPRLDVANDRQLYLVAWPLALAVTAELSRWLPARGFRICMAVLLLGLGSLTLMRNRDYGSEVALWEATARLTPDKARVQNNLGYAYMQAGRKAEAQRAFEASLKLDPAYYRARYNLLQLGRGGS